MNKRIYLDNSATTYVKKEVLIEMLPYFNEKFGNPSSVYKIGKDARNAINVARERVANSIGANSDEIYFTAGGSEADNWAIKGVAFENRDKGNHIITTAIEHPAIMNSCAFLAKQGFEIDYLGVNEYGQISLEELKNKIKDSTILVSIMYANNEVGTVQPIADAAKMAHERGIYFHTDAVQAMGSMKVDVKELDVDLLSMSGHKFYGPKGIGALYVKNGTKIENLIHGGGQENGKRAGTENVAAIVGIGKAAEISHNNLDNNINKIIKLREKFINYVENNIPDVKLNGDRNLRLPGNVNFSFKNIKNGALIEILNLHGIYVSGGSACSSKNSSPSHVLSAMGIDEEMAKSAIRFSIGAQNTTEDIEYVLKTLKSEVEKLRSKLAAD